MTFKFRSRTKFELTDIDFFLGSVIVNASNFLYKNIGKITTYLFVVLSKFKFLILYFYVFCVFEGVKHKNEAKSHI